MEKRKFEGLKNVKVVYGEVVQIEIVKKYYKPLFEKREPSEAHKNGFVGTPGSFDKDGLYIPKNFFKEKKGPIPFERGKIRMPMRRSMYSGKRLDNAISVAKSDAKFRMLCNDPEYAKRVIENGCVKGKFSKKVSKGLKKYRKHLNSIDLNGNPRNLLAYKKGYMKVDGVVRVKKVLKKRKDFFAPEEAVETGIVRE